MNRKNTLITIAENQQKVYEAGKDKMLSDMWENIQNSGERTEYSRAFCGWILDKDMFKPQHDIKMSNSQYLFYASKGNLDLIEVEKECGIVIDFSETTIMSGAFQSAAVSRINVIDASNVTSINYLFSTGGSYYHEMLKWVNKLIIQKGATVTNAFQNVKGLEHCLFEGVISVNGLNVSSCTLLDRESLLSIISCLEDKTEDTSGTVWKVTLGSTNVAKLTQTELDEIGAKGWTYS